MKNHKLKKELIEAGMDRKVAEVLATNLADQEDCDPAVKVAMESRARDMWWSIVPIVISMVAVIIVALK